MVRALSDDVSTEYGRRRKLVSEGPAVRALVRETRDTMVAASCAVLAERTGRPEDDLELRVVVGAVMGGFHQVLWGDHSQEDDLPEMVERALAVLERGLTL
ncbi:hypothetical protein AB0E77_22710 [Streptomyces sp. NPDC032940]|uniref:acyl-CoA-like ligand-binding transcription factor n=1 Tax=Streptomyces sp. NPDC032940 TaxID=3155366 RepID=UPI003400598C